MNFKFVGAVLLVAGNAIGAGMLALPIVSSQAGFIGAILLLLLGWFVMMMGALLLLEVNLWLPQNSNLISMARATLGPIGQLIAWFAYFLLLYSLLCAYIAGGSDLLRHLLIPLHMTLSPSLAALMFTIVFGAVVYGGIRVVDYANRVLMLTKFVAYFLLIILLTPFIMVPQLNGFNPQNMGVGAALTVTITSFGFAAIVPSLRVYFAGEVNKLKWAIILGSLIPLLCYLAWDAAIIGVLPLEGENGLNAILHSSHSTSDLVSALSKVAATNTVNFFIKLFTSICVLTSFLGVALCLVDFLADGLRVEKRGLGSLLVHAMTFMPPFLIVLFFPNAFIKALEYAGVYCIVLLVLLPTWMAWRGRYHKQIANGYKVWGGKALLSVLIIFSLAVIVRGVWG